MSRKSFQSPIVRRWVEQELIHGLTPEVVFTSSTLGNGGFPEYTFDSYYAPNQGGELYEVTPAGSENTQSPI